MNLPLSTAFTVSHRFWVVVFSFSFISALIFMISFLLLTLGLFCSSFSSCLMCKVRLFDVSLVS